MLCVYNKDVAVVRFHASCLTSTKCSRRPGMHRTRREYQPWGCAATCPPICEHGVAGDCQRTREKAGKGPWTWTYQWPSTSP